MRRAAGEGMVSTYSRHPVMHTARKGETALSVADDYAVPVEMVRKWNHLRGNQLRAGQTLRIYKPAGRQAAREPCRYPERSAANVGLNPTR